MYERGSQYDEGDDDEGDDTPFSRSGRFLGIQDLVRRFDSARRDRAGREKGWPLALMHMLVDPLLCAWARFGPDGSFAIFSPNFVAWYEYRCARH